MKEKAIILQLCNFSFIADKHKVILTPFRFHQYSHLKDLLTLGVSVLILYA